MHQIIFFTDYDPDPESQAGRRTLNIAFMFASQAAAGLFENIRKFLKYQDNKCKFVTPTAVGADIASLVPNTSNIFPAWTEAVSILWRGIHFNEAVDYLTENLPNFLHAFENPMAEGHTKISTLRSQMKMPALSPTDNSAVSP
ncbi:MAG: hypothetical protein ACRYG8_39325 [Janthinobacterium lividum]